MLAAAAEVITTGCDKVIPCYEVAASLAADDSFEPEVCIKHFSYKYINCYVITDTDDNLLQLPSLTNTPTNEDWRGKDPKARTSAITKT